MKTIRSGEQKLNPNPHNIIKTTVDSVQHRFHCFFPFVRINSYGRKETLAVTSCPFIIQALFQNLPFYSFFPQQPLNTCPYRVVTGVWFE